MAGYGLYYRFEDSNDRLDKFIRPLNRFENDDLKQNCIMTSLGFALWLAKNEYWKPWEPDFEVVAQCGTFYDITDLKQLVGQLQSSGKYFDLYEEYITQNK